MSVTGEDIQNGVSHWVNTPVNAYFGCDYGQDLKALLQRAMNDAGYGADEQIAKLRADVIALGIVPSESINLYAVQSGVDKMQLVLEIAGQVFSVG